MNDSGSAIGNFFAILISFLAVLISLYSAYINRKSLITTSIASNRMEWIKTVRELIAQFIEEYEKKGEDKAELIRLYNRIMLYFNRSHESYECLVDAMKRCLECDYSIERCWDVIHAAQIVLEGPWVRMKREAGITAQEEADVVQSVHKAVLEQKEVKWSVNWNADQN